MGESRRPEDPARPSSWASLPGVRAFDTHPEAGRAQLEILRRMDGGERLGLALSISQSVRQVAESGIRSRHPEYGDAEVRRAMTWLLYGEALCRALWPELPLARP